MTPKELVAGGDVEALEIRPPKAMSLSGVGAGVFRIVSVSKRTTRRKRLDVGSLVPYFYHEGPSPQ